MSTISIGTELAEQYARAWQMLRSAVRELPEEQWRSGEVTSLVPARHACHVVETADFYSAAVPPDQFGWGRRIGGFWDAMPAGKLPPQGQLLEYLDEVARNIDSWLRASSDQDLLSPEELFPWTGRTVLGRALYLLRHIQHHLAEINAELRRRDLPILDWR